MTYAYVYLQPSGGKSTWMRRHAFPDEVFDTDDLWFGPEAPLGHIVEPRDRSTWLRNNLFRLNGFPMVMSNIAMYEDEVRSHLSWGSGAPAHLVQYYPTAHCLIGNITARHREQGAEILDAKLRQGLGIWSDRPDTAIAATNAQIDAGLSAHHRLAIARSPAAWGDRLRILEDIRASELPTQQTEDQARRPTAVSWPWRR